MRVGSTVDAMVSEKAAKTADNSVATKESHGVERTVVESAVPMAVVTVAQLAEYEERQRVDATAELLAYSMAVPKVVT